MTNQIVQGRNFLREYCTLTGFTMSEALTQMQAVLPPAAYKSIPGSNADLTDIDPSYLTEWATRLFGACGIGWFYDYAPESLSIVATEKTAKSGRQYTNYDALITRLELVYTYFDNDGNQHFSTPIVSNGGSGNEDRGYAVRGAITNAIGAAFAKLLWQLPVYKGIVTHQNAAEKYSAQQKKAGVSGNVSETSKAAEVKPELNLSLKVPENTNIPTGGQTLEAVCKDKQFGEATLTFLAGRRPNVAGVVFDPADDEGKLIKETCNEILDSGNYEKTSKKAK
jgi:hypothetical protein